MKQRFSFLVIFVFAFLVVFGSNATAQELDTDTMKIVDGSIPANDTADVYIRLVNTVNLGGYTMRFIFDPSIIRPVKYPDESPQAEEGDSLVLMTQLRGDMEAYSAGNPEPNSITMVAYTWSPEGMPPGAENTVSISFFAMPGVTSGTTTDLFFEDAAYDTNAYNWFALADGMSQYRPKRLGGTITIGAGTENDPPTISTVSSPVTGSVGVPISFSATATDPDGDFVTLQASDLPSGAAFNPNPATGSGTASGTFNWTPAIGQNGTFTVRFQAHDDQNNYSAYTNIVINVSAGGVPTIDPLNSPITVNQGSVVEFSVVARDPEGEGLTLSASNLPPGAEFTPSTSIYGIGTVSGLFHWSPSFQQSGQFIVQFRAEDDLGNQSAISSVVIDVKEVPLDQLFTTSVEGQSPQGGVPGATDVIVPINFVAIEETYGIQFDLVYDPAIFVITDIVPTERLNGFSVFDDVGETPGRIRVVTFSLAGTPIGTAGSEVFNVVGQIAPTAPPGRYDLKFEDAWESVNPNPEVPGKMLATIDGHIFVDILGDVNADGLINVADAVAVVHNILGSQSFTTRQFGAANVIVDEGINVYDLQGIVNIIFDRPIQPAPINGDGGVLAKVEFPFDPDEGPAGAYRLWANSPAEISGIQVEIVYDPLQVKLVPPEPTSLAARLDMQYLDNKVGRMTVIMWTMDWEAVLPIGENEIFGMRIEPGPAGIEGHLPPVQLRDVKLCTPEASKILLETDVPRAFELFQNYPNPFNPRTVIEFDLAPQEDGGGLVDTRLEVYNILGQKVATLVNAPLPPGRHAVEWQSATDDGRPVGSGVYFYKLVAGTKSETKKMVLLK